MQSGAVLLDFVCGVIIYVLNNGNLPVCLAHETAAAMSNSLQRYHVTNVAAEFLSWPTFVLLICRRLVAFLPMSVT